MFAIFTAFALLVQIPAAVQESNIARYRELIAPKKTDLEFEATPWRASLWSAIVEANEQDKPIVLWAMNGHPLACT